MNVSRAAIGQSTYQGSISIPRYLPGAQERSSSCTVPRPWKRDTPEKCGS
jgi:hypothetical protein